MITTNRFALLFLLGLSACRTPGDSGLSSEASLAASFRTDFDWGRLAPDGQVTPIRKLTFCFDKSLPEGFRHPFLLAASSINAAGLPHIDRWQLLTKGKPPYLCPNNWNPNSAADSDLAHIRIKAVNNLGLPPKVGFAPYKIDFDSSMVFRKPLPPEAEGIVPSTPIGVSTSLASFTFHRDRSFSEYIYAAEIAVNALSNDEGALDWSTEFGTVVANNSFDPLLLALHMFGHVIRLEHDETLLNGTQHMTCGSLQEGLYVRDAITSTTNQALTITAAGDDETSQDGLAITPGKNNIVETSKEIPIMFPFMRMGTHCRNPKGSGLENMAHRFRFTAREIKAIKASASHK